MKSKKVNINEGAGGAGCQSVGSSINLNNTGTRQTKINTGTQFSINMGERIKEAFNKLDYTYTGT